MDFEQADRLNAAIRTVAIRHRVLAGTLLAPLGLHPGQEVLLLELSAQGPRTQTELAAASGCEPPTITGSVRKLEAAGLVTRRPSATDGRAVVVELSELGRRVLPDLEAAWLELAERTVRGLRYTTPQQLSDALVDLAENLSVSGDRNPASPARPDPHAAG